MVRPVLARQFDCEVARTMVPHTDKLRQLVKSLVAAYGGVHSRGSDGGAIL